MTTKVQYAKQQTKMLSPSLISNQETVNQLNLKNPAQTLKDIHITYVIQLTEATQKKPLRTTTPNTRGSCRHLVKGHSACSECPAVHCPSTLGSSAWASATLPFADGEQNPKLISPQNSLQLASVLAAVLVKMQQAATPVTAAQHSPQHYPAAAAKLQQTEPQHTRLASSPNLKPQLKKSTSLRNKGEWEKGAFCLKCAFLARFPLENSCEQ